jgi:hypothetical protein
LAWINLGGRFAARVLSQATCVYALPHKRGRKSHVPLRNIALPTSTESTRLNVAPEPHLHSVDNNSRLPLRDYPDNLNLGNADIIDLPATATPDVLTDLHGQYVGPSSDLHFLARVRKRLGNSDQTSFTFTFGDAPIAEYDPTPSTMISNEGSARLVETFFDFTIPIDRIVHRFTINEWLGQFQQTMGTTRDRENAPAQRALLWMIFAMAQEHTIQTETVKAEDRRFAVPGRLLHLGPRYYRVYR